MYLRKYAWQGLAWAWSHNGLEPQCLEVLKKVLTWWMLLTVGWLYIWNRKKMSWWEMSWFPHNVVYWHCQYPRFQRWQKHSCYHDLIILTISEIFRGKVRPVLLTDFGSRTFCQLAGKRVYISRIGLVDLFTHSKGRLFYLVSAETSWLCSCMQTNNNRTLDINNRQSSLQMLKKVRARWVRGSDIESDIMIPWLSPGVNILISLNLCPAATDNKDRAMSLLLV